ncbi:putative membrane protein SirB2 [Chitinivorax tropicus]|uniref:Putative membrane protein SirB2 n=2 Tax=Chitinivorax tropicus TaxID=714531 RepID=A0A840MMQ3_9PROT|nr:DUF2818 family protein [Chitinivorax tropicus]MBB5017786.1 putative membrane protein SirB2 [Chitinivorax tropicus]
MLLLAALVAANLPFASNRLFCVFNTSSGKGLAWRLLELIALYVVIGLASMSLEGRFGPIQDQKWQFYVTTLAVFVVMAVPGFVYRYLWRKAGI